MLIVLFGWRFQSEKPGIHQESIRNLPGRPGIYQEARDQLGRPGIYQEGQESIRKTTRKTRNLLGRPGIHQESTRKTGNSVGIYQEDWEFTRTWPGILAILPGRPGIHQDLTRNSDNPTRKTRTSPGIHQEFWQSYQEDQDFTRNSPGILAILPGRLGLLGFLQEYVGQGKVLAFVKESAQGKGLVRVAELILLLCLTLTNTRACVDRTSVCSS